jgi:plastocyanin
MGRMMDGRGMGAMMGGSSTGPCPSHGETSSVVIQGFRFCPTPLRAHAGTTVTWTNDDNVSHTVTSRSGAHFDSGSLARGRSWSHRFDQAGTFTYYCAVHPWMEGTLAVTA